MGPAFPPERLEGVRRESRTYLKKAPGESRAGYRTAKRKERGWSGNWARSSSGGPPFGEALRRILVEDCRRKRALKRGGGLRRQEWPDVEPAAPAASDDLLALDEALTQLAQTDALAANLVQLRYFAGLTSRQAADALGI